MADLDTSVQYIHGIGPARAKSLEKLGITTLGELISWFPRRYEDRSAVRRIADLEAGESACVEAMIASPPTLSHIRKGMDLIKVRAVDESGVLDVTFFNQTWLKDNLHQGQTYLFYGRAEGNLLRKQMASPVVEPVGRREQTGRIVPIYPLTAGVSQLMLSRSIRQGLDACAAILPDALPDDVRQAHALCRIGFAYENIHFPASPEALELARRRLAFEELFLFSLGLAQLRSRREVVEIPPCPAVDMAPFYAALPFTLTGAQRRCVDEALSDMRAGRPMNRLCQGDVGSGKTMVAAACEKDLPVASALGKAVGGVGPVVAREAVWRAFGGETPLLACDLDEAQKQALCAAIENLKDEHAAGGTPTAVRIPQPDGVNKPVEFSFFIPQQYGSAAILTQYPTYSELLEDYYATKDRAERLKQKSRELYKAVHNLYERAVRKQSARREELAQSEKADTLRLYGELLQANQWAIQKGDRQATVQNYYTGEDVTIRLDPRLGPNENAQKYFRDYKKKQTAGQMLKKLLLEGEDEIEYLANVLYEVETAPGEQALNEVRAELKSQGYLKYYKQRERKQKPADFLRYRSSDGFEILIGRNNLQNDKLTLHTARGKDVWFHVQKAPGSHTVVMSRGEDVPDTTKQEAAELAVLHSSQNGGAKVPVDTTEVRNIWKANGARPGMVLYNDYTTVYITPRAGLEEQLREK